MAAAAHISARIYGEVEGDAPYQNAAGLANFSRVKPYPSAQIVSFATGNTEYWTLPNGFQMPSGVYVYSVIRENATGLQTHGKKYVSDSSAATLATNAG
jgi:hypothetical protein